jgi:hypothetical protein
MPLSPPFRRRRARASSVIRELNHVALRANNPSAKPAGTARCGMTHGACAAEPTHTPDGRTRTTDGRTQTTAGRARSTDGPTRSTDGPTQSTDGPTQSTDGATRTTDGPMQIARALHPRITYSPPLTPPAALGRHPGACVWVPGCDQGELPAGSLGSLPLHPCMVSNGRARLITVPREDPRHPDN